MIYFDNAATTLQKPRTVARAVRFSFSWFNTEDEINQALEALRSL